MSWHNPRNPGYPYPEAAGLWLSWRIWRDEFGPRGQSSQQARAVTRRLAAELEEGGAVGRGGELYLFDTCVALDALVRAGHVGMADVPAREFLVRRLPAVERFLPAERPVLSPRPVPHRWSTSWSPHLGRAAALLSRAGQLGETEEIVALARRLRARANRAWSPSHRSLTHAHLYALEGELLFRALGEAPYDLGVGDELQQLAGIQRSDGGLPAWTDGSGPARTDATAQAIRLWAVFDREGLASHVESGLRFLADQQHASGGLVYEPGCADLNTWASVFADQAVHWARGSDDLVAWI